MEENLEKITKLCSGIKFTGNTSKEYLFTVNCVDYFFFEKNIGEVDIRDGFTDGANDGGIDFICDDGNKLYLIQGKSQADLKYNDIRNAFAKILETVNNFKSGNTDSYNSKLKAIYKNALEKMDNPEIEFLIFTNTVIDRDVLRKVEELNNNGDFQNFHLSIYGKDDIDNKVLSVDNGNMFVAEGTLELNDSQSLIYQNGTGAIFTIKAFSLKELWDKKRNDGLFGYNLREHISQQTVDNQIDRTIKEEKDNFWYYNNGITIGCKDFYRDGNKLKLYEFSIINGAQTTTKIGRSPLVKKDNDFCLVCKVIKSENSLDDEFIRNISEASNSQKPIRPKDLKSNSAEQKILQNNCLKNGNYQLAVEIKRGVKPDNWFKLDQWQRVTNEYVGQVLMATQFQKPGTARSKKADIFGNNTTYLSIFSKDKVKKYDYNTLYDLVKLAHLYDIFKIKYVEKRENEISNETDEKKKKPLNDLISVCNNAKFVTIALIAYFIKKLYFNMKDSNDDTFNEPIIRGDLSLNYPNDDYDKKLDYLFAFIIAKLSMIYNTNEVSLKLTSHSNFFKTDVNYRDVIIPEFDKILNDQYDDIKILDNIVLFDDKKNSKAKYNI